MAARRSAPGAFPDVKVSHGKEAPPSGRLAGIGRYRPGGKVIPSFLSLHFEITTIAVALGCSAVFVSLILLLSNAGGLELA